MNLYLTVAAAVTVGCFLMVCFLLSRGLQGTKIPVVARIIRVADTYSALIDKRVYRDAKSQDKALGILIDGRGKEFDPLIVDALLRIVEQKDTAIA